MKQLFINGEQVIMDSDQYFPFTYKLSDLEEINLINFPSTKSIMIPKTIRNDDIFGHIAEITRLTYGYEDSKVGVSFNQFKKGQYELLDNNVVISKGIIRIVNITDDEYEIELYDQAIELLEILEDKNLDQLTIINPQTGLPLSERVNYATVADMIIKDYGILPIFGDYDTPYEGSKMFIRKKSGPSVSELEVELPVSMTPLKLRTFSAADIPYVIKLNNIFNMIEAEGDVIFSQSVRDLTTHTRMLLSKPINSLITSETKGKLHTFNRPTLGEASNGNITITDLMYLQNADSSNILFFNGNYLIKNKFKFVFETNSTQSGSI